MAPIAAPAWARPRPALTRCLSLRALQQARNLTPAINEHRSSRASPREFLSLKNRTALDSSAYQESTTINLVPAYQER
jgi:hypothetical protein